MESSPGFSCQTQRYNSAETPQLEIVLFPISPFRIAAKQFVHTWSLPWPSHGFTMGEVSVSPFKSWGS